MLKETKTMTSPTSTHSPKRGPLGFLPLRVVLIIPFVLQLFGAVGLVGHLSFRSGQSAV